jgi:aquaporin Z
MIRKFISEFVGTMLLVFFGCGTAVAVSTYLKTITGGAVLPYSLLVVSLAFGLILVALIAMIGKISGCHVNPAVSVANVIAGRMSIFDCVYYVVAQVVGGIAGAGLLSMIFGETSSLGANCFEASTTVSLGSLVIAQTALLIE